MSYSSHLTTKQQTHLTTPDNSDIPESNATTQKNPPLNLVRSLCKMMEAEEICYCHWKSNAAIDRSASGDNDLDLLISRADGQRFAEILYRLDFKEAHAIPEKELPGVLNFYGYDKEADKIVHVHAHYQLILGHDATKNYRLPIEKPFLDSATQDNLFKVPSLEFELIVFVIRMILKHSTWDTILGNQGGLSAREQQELHYLTSQVNQTQLDNILNQHLPYIGIALFNDCVQALQASSTILFRCKAGYRLQRQLKGDARRSQISDVILKVWRRGIWKIRRHIFKQRPKKKLNNGGAMLALVGGDGAGKSTAVEQMYSWLSKDFDTIKIHLGRPPRTWTVFVVKAVLKIELWLGPGSSKKTQAHSAVDVKPTAPEFPGYGRLLWYVLTAHDRYRAYSRARRFATNGGLVICDRFPLPQIKLMDGARINQMVNLESTNRLVNFLIKTEEKYYQHIMLPDLLVVLKLDPEIAVQRKTSESATSVRIRNKEIWELDWQQTSAYVIDASQPGVQVLSELKSLIWSIL